MKIGGLSGLLEVLMVLGWWGVALNSDSLSSAKDRAENHAQWTGAVDDVVWVLKA